MKTQIHRFLLSLSFFVAAGAAFSQSFYQFSKSTRPYSALPVAQGTIITQAFGQPSYAVALAMPVVAFDYDIGNQLSIGKNGFIVGTGIQRSLAIDPCVTGLSPANANASLSYFYVPENNDSVLVVQWTNMVPDSANAGDYVNFQARVYLKGQHIEYHYGPSQLTAAKFVNGRADISTVLFLLSADFSTAYESYTLYGSPASPGLSADPNSVGTLDSFPPEGTVYTFWKNSGMRTEEISFIPQVTVYPNPAIDNLFINSNLGIKNVLIYNALGVLQNIRQTNENEINITDLPNGIYTVHIETGVQTTVKKIIINR